MSKAFMSDPIIESIEELVSIDDGRAAEAFVKNLLSTASAREVKSFFFYASLKFAAAKKNPSSRASRRKSPAKAGARR